MIGFQKQILISRHSLTVMLIRYLKSFKNFAILVVLHKWTIALCCEENKEND